MDGILRPESRALYRSLKRWREAEGHWDEQINLILTNPLGATSPGAGDALDVDAIIPSQSGFALSGEMDVKTAKQVRGYFNALITEVDVAVKVRNLLRAAGLTFGQDR